MSSAYFERHPSLRPLAYRDYRFLLGGLALVQLAAPFQFLTQVFWLQQEYPDHATLYASLIAASRGLAMVVFSLVGGAIADRLERRRILLATETASLFVNGVIAFLMIASPVGEATVAAVTLCTFASSGVMSIDGPARSASMPSIVGMENLASAMGLSMVITQVTMPISLSMVGVLNGLFDPGQVYAGSLLVWAGILPMIAALRYHSIGGGGRDLGMVASIREGIRYARASAAISGILLVVVVVQFAGMPVATPLGPVFMIEVLDFTTAQVGFMGMTWGLGSLAASFLLARFRWLTLRGDTLAAMTLAFGVGVVGFGLSRYVPVTAVFDFLFGFGFTATSLVSATIVQHTVADNVRGRVMGLFPFTLGFANLCTAPIGLAGQQFGLALLVPALGVTTLVLCASVFATRPQLLSIRARAVAAATSGEP
ncbi:MAG: MFS transporter [Dehalococcoidia bacterium]|nr:MFS transporter [Dehalococcoidia bacterium]